MGEVVSEDELARRVADLRARGQRIALANGHFDLLHVGHLRYLRAARAEADALVVAINDDDSVARLKGPGRPLVPAAERAELLAALDAVDFVVVFAGDSPAPLLARLRPDVHCKGTDYGTPEQVPEHATVAAYGGVTRLVGDPKDHATRDLIARVRALPRGGGGSVVRAAFAFLGGGLVLAGLILVVAENWELLHRGVKLAGWAAILVLLLVATEMVARRRPERAYLAETLSFVAGGWVMAGIALVSQIYHLDSRPANGLWLWLALVLPAAWVLRRRGVAAVVFTALVSALAFEVTAGDSWVHADEVAGPWLWLAIPLLAAFAVSWLPAAWRGLTGWVGAWFFAAGNVFLLVLGSGHFLDRSDLGAAWVVAGAGVAAALALPGRCLPASWSPTAARLIVVATFLPWVFLGSRFEEGVGLDLFAIGVAWAAQLAVAVLAIWTGAGSGSKLWINLGYLALLAGILTRYFDLFGDYLQGGAALALTGVLVLVVLFALERARRRTVERGVAA